MKKSSLMILSLVAAIFVFNSCSVIGGIFKTGMSVGIFIVVVIIVFIVIGVIALRPKK